MPLPMERKYYDDHAQRYPRMSEDERKEYPDEIFHKSWGWIKRERDWENLTPEDWKRYGPDLIALAAKNIPIYRALPYH